MEARRNLLSSRFLNHSFFLSSSTSYFVVQLPAIRPSHIGEAVQNRCSISRCTSSEQAIRLALCFSGNGIIAARLKNRSRGTTWEWARPSIRAIEAVRSNGSAAILSASR
jgi:hypothetical protein